MDQPVDARAWYHVRFDLADPREHKALDEVLRRSDLAVALWSTEACPAFFEHKVGPAFCHRATSFEDIFALCRKRWEKLQGTLQPVAVLVQDSIHHHLTPERLLWLRENVTHLQSIRLVLCLNCEAATGRDCASYGT